MTSDVTAVVNLRAVQTVLTVRARSWWRGASEVARTEPISVTIAAACAVVAAWYVVGIARTPRGAAAVLAVTALLISLVHGARTDERSLEIAGIPARRLFAAEYMLLVAPVVLLLLAGAQIRAATIVPMIVAACVLAPSGHLRDWLARRKRRAPVHLPLPPSAFEWMAGLRRAWPALLIVETLGVLLSLVPAIPLLALFALAWLSGGFFLESTEGWALLEAFGRPSAQFLRRKIGTSLALFALLASPLVLVELIRNPIEWPILILAFSCAALVHGGAVLLKYALYVPGARKSFAGVLGLTALTAALMLPPMACWLVYRLWHRACQRLDPYLQYQSALHVID